MKKSIDRRRKITLGGLLLFIVLLTAVGFLLQDKIRVMFTAHVEKQAAMQADMIARRLDDRLHNELLMMEDLSKACEHEKWGNLPTGDDQGVLMGVLPHQGNALVGRSLLASDWPGIMQSFQGHPAVCYNKGRGLLFTVPVYSGANIKYVLYRLYKEERVQSEFQLDCFDSKGKALLATSAGYLHVTDNVWSTADMAYLRSAENAGLLDKLKKELYSTRSAATYDAGNVEWDENNIVFMAEVKQLNGRLVGFVPLSAIGGDLLAAVRLVIWVFGLLILLFIIVTVTLFSAEKRSWESDELREAKRLADQANKAKSDFLANMSHEIRTPINAVMGMDEMILRESKDANVREYAQNIDGASKTLLALINDVLDFSKVEAGKMDIVAAEYDLGDVLTDVVNMVQIKAEQKGLAFQLHAEESLPRRIYGDPTRVRQVIINVLNNAVKYTQQGSVTLALSRGAEMAASEELLGGRPAVTLEVRVTDTGIGIKDEDMKNLFKNFVRLDEEKNRNVEGTGLGLALTHRLVGLMGGQVQVDSVYGKGSTFTIRLPQGIVDEAPLGDFVAYRRRKAAEQTCYHETFTAPEAKVLAVDDNRMNRFVVKSLLKSTQVQVSLAASGSACIEALQREKFDVVLLDHMMPGMDGMETLRRVREQHLCDETPFIALTANAIVGSREKYLAAGFTDYLSKPIKSALLEAMLCQYLPVEKVHRSAAETAADGDAAAAGSDVAAAATGATGSQATAQPTTASGRSPALFKGGQESAAAAGDTAPGAGAVAAGDAAAAAGNAAPASDAAAAAEPEVLIDRALGMKYSSDDTDLYGMMLSMFADAREEELAKIEAALAEKNWKNYATGAHALKSTSLSIGARELSEQAKELEFAGKREDAAYIGAHHAAVMELYARVAAVAADMAAGNGS